MGNIWRFTCSAIMTISIMIPFFWMCRASVLGWWVCTFHKEWISPKISCAPSLFEISIFGFCCAFRMHGLLYTICSRDTFNVVLVTGWLERCTEPTLRSEFPKGLMRFIVSSDPSSLQLWPHTPAFVYLAEWRESTPFEMHWLWNGLSYIYCICIIQESIKGKKVTI